MNADETTLLPQESLALIAEAIRKTKENFRENSRFFLLWGWLIMAASVAFFLLRQYTGTRFFFLPFPVLVVAGIVTTLIWYRQMKADAPTETYIGYFFNRMWLVLGVSFILVVFVSLSRGWTPFLYTLVVAGIGTMVSGLAMKFRPLVWGGVLFFSAAVAGVYLPNAGLPLLNGVAMIGGYLIPGYLLKAAHE
ncbi:MAG TPA: hypothetical protein VG101_16210 [Puia sp.]|jgi:hypothetical protein|nr:hypothetical protein [Puia sp.]